MKYSKNVKLNNVLNQIEKSLICFGKPGIQRCMESFPDEPDYNIVHYGKTVICYWEIRKMYIDAGYESFRRNRISDNKMWEIYRRQVGYVARKLMESDTFLM